MGMRLSFRRRGGGFAFALLVTVVVVALCCVGRLGLCAATTTEVADDALSSFSSSTLSSTSSASFSSSSPFAPSGKDFPNPTLDPAACNRPAGRPSWLCDPDRILSRSAADEIEGTLRDIAQAKKPFAKSPCGSSSGQRAGFQVGLAALGRLDLSEASSASASDAAAEFASSIMDLWGVGQAGCDDGVVVVLAKEDRQSYILAGRGALSKLPPRASSAILEAAKPLLRAGDTAGALKQIVVDVGLTLAGAPPPRAGGAGIDWSTLLFFAVVVAIVVTSARAAAQQRAQQRAASEAIEKLRREQAAAEAAARAGGGGGDGAASAPSPFASSSCPVCLEDFTPNDGGSADADDDDGGEGGGGAGAGAGGLSESSRPSAPLLPAFLRPSSSTAPSAPPLPRRCVRPLTMHCGHVFCGDCISRWTESGHDTCPICRAPLAAPPAPAAAAAAAAAAPASSSSPPSSSSSYRPYPGTHNYRDELAFRLGSLHRLYPAVVTAEILSEWLGQARRGAPLAPWESVRAAQLSNNSRLAARRRHEGARYGAVGGFGGGSSAGGGGAGSSW